jgi:hypothetical protein
LRSRSSRQIGRHGIVGWSLVTLAWDVVLVIVGVNILWLNGGVTVSTGPLFGLVLFVAALSVCLFARAVFPGRPAGPDFSSASVAFERNLVIGDAILLAGAVTAWIMSSSYFVGWVAVFAASIFFTGLVIQLLTDVLTGRASQRAPGGRERSRPVITSLEFTRLLAIVWAIVAFLVLEPVHEWRELLLNPLTVMLVLAIGIHDVFIHLFVLRDETASGERPSNTLRTRERGQLWL